MEKEEDFILSSDRKRQYIRYLNKGGYILFEIGFDQGKDVSRTFEK